MNFKEDQKSKQIEQHIWGRKDLDYFQLSDIAKNPLTRCPAATAGYQLMHQKAQANGIFKSGRYEYLVSFDERNQPFIKCLSTTGIRDFRTEGTKIYNHEASFTTWRQEYWVNYVRSNSTELTTMNWLKYMKAR